MLPHGQELSPSSRLLGHVLPKLPIRMAVDRQAEMALVGFQGPAGSRVEVAGEQAGKASLVKKLLQEEHMGSRVPGGQIGVSPAWNGGGAGSHFPMDPVGGPIGRFHIGKHRAF